MPTVTTQQTFELALQHHQAGRLGEAEALYRQILAGEPKHAEALHHLGLIAHQVGRDDLAVEWIRQALFLDPNHPAAHSNLGDVYQSTGRIDEAIASFRRAVQLKPDYPEAYYNLGNALSAGGESGEAIAAFRRALQLKPDYAEAHNNLGMALAGQGQFDGAIAAYRRALQLKPDQPTIHNNLGIALKARDQLEEASAAYRRALELQPNYPQAHYNLGNALGERGQLEEAMAAYRRALELKADLPEAHNNLGDLLSGRGQFEEALAAFRRALHFKPDFVEAHNNLGNALRNLDRSDEAIASFHRALQLDPDYPQAHYNLGNALRDRGQLDDAVARYQHVLELKPDDADTHNNLGNALKDQGKLDEAIAAYRRALEIRPAWAGVHSNVVYTLHVHPEQDERLIVEERRRWNREFCELLQRFILPHANDRSPGRRLKIGYVSPDFRSHPVSFFLAPLLEAHDHGPFEIYCYANVRRPDTVTERLSKSADIWRDVRALSDDQLAECVRDDGIDILVDLAMHTACNRLPAFARRPAPVQVSWLAYPGSTGMEAIDYRLTDACIDPAGQEAEELGGHVVHLPDAWCCYAPIAEFPPVGPLPAAQKETVTFGSLNQFRKLHDGLLLCWARLLAAVPESRLLMVCPEGRTAERIHALFAAQGIARERVELVARCPWADYIRLFGRIDLALDAYPCNGMTTTCHALWMGVPVVTLAGTSAISRAGLSLLHTIGLPGWVARNEEEYIRIATWWATDLSHLAELRRTLRTRMQASPLMDAPRFARHIEAAYRTMWQRWCGAANVSE